MLWLNLIVCAVIHDISRTCSWLAVDDSAVIGGHKSASRNYDVKNWCNVSFLFSQSQDKQQFSFTFSVELLKPINQAVQVNLLQTDCAQSSDRNLLNLVVLPADSSVQHVRKWNFTSDAHCFQRLSMYQGASIAGAKYEVRIVITVHSPCDNHMSMRCAQSGECIRRSLSCDGFSNCLDGSDENVTCTMSPQVRMPVSASKSSATDNSIFWFICGFLGVIMLLVAMTAWQLCLKSHRRYSRTQLPSTVTDSRCHGNVYCEDAPPRYENLLVCSSDEHELPPSYEIAVRNAHTFVWPTVAVSLLEPPSRTWKLKSLLRFVIRL